VNSCFSLIIRKKILEISSRTDTNNDSSKSTNVKSEINPYPAKVENMVSF